MNEHMTSQNFILIFHLKNSVVFFIRNAYSPDKHSPQGRYHYDRRFKFLKGKCKLLLTACMHFKLYYTPFDSDNRFA